MKATRPEVRVLLGKTNRKTGDLIGLSARTEEFHRINIMIKPGAENMAGLVTNERRSGLG